MNSSDSHLMGAASQCVVGCKANTVLWGRGSRESFVASAAVERLSGGAMLLPLLRLLGVPLLQLRMSCFHSNRSEWYRMAPQFQKGLSINRSYLLGCFYHQWMSSGPLCRAQMYPLPVSAF